MTFFTIPSAPVSKARTRVTSHGTYTPKNTRDYEQLVRLEYAKQCGEYFGDKALIVDIIANVPIPKSKPKTIRKEMQAGRIRPTSKPDCDNIAKAVLDALNGIAYHDDSQVVCLCVGKWYSDAPCVIVSIKEAIP